MMNIQITKQMVDEVSNKIDLCMSVVPELKKEIQQKAKQKWMYGEDWSIADRDIKIDGVDYTVIVVLRGASVMESNPRFCVRVMNNETGIISDDIVC